MERAVQILCLVFIVLLTSTAGVDTYTNCSNVLVGENANLMLDCTGIGEIGNRWKYNEQRIYLNNNYINAILGNSVTLLRNYSLNINSTSLDHEGSFECIRNSTHVITYCVEIFVRPQLSVLVDGFDNVEIDVEASSELVLRCIALRSKPVATLEWLVNDVVLPTSTIKTTTDPISDDGRFFDTTSVLEYKVEFERGNITCIHRVSNTDADRRVQVSFLTYVPPVLLMYHDGVTITGDAIVIYDRLEHEIKCTARAARPPVDIIIEFDGREQSQVEVTTNQNRRQGSFKNTTYDTTVSADYKISKGNKVITCIAFGEYQSQAKKRTVNVTLRESSRDPSAVENSGIPYVLLPVSLCITLIAVVILISVPCIVVRRCRQIRVRQHLNTTRARRPSFDDLNVQTHRKQASEVDSPALPNVKGETCFTYEFSLPRASLISEAGNKKITEEPHLWSPKLSLPDVPPAAIEISHEYSETEGVYYSDLKQTVDMRKLFNYQELCMIMSLKVGKVHNRWMASTAVPNQPTKCVFVSTVTDHILTTRELHWDLYVKRVLELPEMDCLIKTEGICIDGAKLYLIQEHTTCLTMDSYIYSSMQQSGTSFPNPGFSSTDLKRWIVDILKGMEMVHSYGLLHPGLSNKKILLTDRRIPKLYDFCLAEDAKQKVLLQKEKMACSRNQLAPEALSRNEYSTASDVWSIGVVFWELLTGSLPFLSDIIGTLKGSEYTFKVDWPIEYTGIMNEQLFDCWMDDSSIRPSMRQLRLSFEEMDRLLRKNNGEDINALDLYVPMKGIISSVENKKSNSV